MMRFTAGKSRGGRRLGAAFVLAGLVAGSLGALVEVAVANSALALGLDVCGASRSIVPGDAGSCSETVRDTSNSTSIQVNVALVISTTSTSGGGASGSGVGTEAVLDGQPNGLQVNVTDSNTGQTFSLGTIYCRTDSSKLSRAPVYPNASYCTSSSRSQTVDNASFSNTFVIRWSFPLAADNPYQGSGATVQLQSTYTGAGGSGTLGASTGPNGGALAASTPTTGARLPETLGQLLVGAGVLLALVGMFLYMRGQRSRPFPPPTS